MLLGTVPYSLENSVAFLYGKVTSIPLEDSKLVWELVFFPVLPVHFFEQPLFTEMRREYSVLVHFVSRYKLVEEPEKLINLRLGEICVVTRVLHFKRVRVLAFTCHKVGQGTQAWVADGDSHSVVPVFLQELNKHCLTIEASFAPAAKSDSVIFFYHGFPSAVAVLKIRRFK
jgi:hypothetical protein